MSHIIKQSQSSFFPHHKISRLSAGCCPDPDPPLRCCDVISNHDSISRVYLILPAVSHELLIMHRRAPTCFSAYISWRTKSCIPPHPLQTTSSPLYPNQEAQRHVFFFLLFFSFFFTETLWWLQQRRIVKRKRALMLMLLTTTVDHC